MTLYSFQGPFVNGIPTFPYIIAFDNHYPFMGMCDDYYHDGSPGDTWPAYLTNLWTGDLSHVRFASAGLVAYQEAAWILLQAGATAPGNWPDMNFAVWHFFNSTVPINQNSQYWIDLAAANYQNGDYRTVWVATPIPIDAPPTGDQEFLFIWDNGSPPIPPRVPEPGSITLLATATLTTAAALRRRLH